MVAMEQAIGNPTAMEVLGKTILVCYEGLEAIEMWNWWRTLYPETSELLIQYVGRHDSLEGMPKELHECFRNMPSADRDNLVNYVASRYNPLIYRGPLNSCASVDRHNIKRKAALISLIIALREEWDSGRYQRTWDYANGSCMSPVPIGVKECFQRLYIATYRAVRGTFHPFALSREWLDCNRPWAEECNEKLKASGEI